MTRLLLVRHGESQANKDRYFAGQVDPPLTELGLRQAQCTAKFLAEAYRIDAVIASDLQRAAETGRQAALAAGVPFSVDPGLREIYAGRWEGVAFDRLWEVDPEAQRLWNQDIGHARCPGGESVEELAHRIYSTVARICEENPGKTLVLACHATPIRVLMWHMSGRELGYVQQIPWVSNASVTEVTYENGTLTPVKVCQDAHLQDMVTKLPTKV